jgi:predicted RNA-binding protein with RPS1 domain
MLFLAVATLPHNSKSLDGRLRANRTMAASSLYSTAIAASFVLLFILRHDVCAFQSASSTTNLNQRRYAVSSIRSATDGDTIDSMFGPRVDDGEDEVLYSDDDDSDSDWGVPSATAAEPRKERRITSRWGSLNPKIKARIVKEAQERAIRNKKKREPAEAKKRRLYSKYREMQQKSKRESYVQRDKPTYDSSRTKLADLNPGETVPGRVISLTNFGAYVDIGTEVDGLLHVSQISRDEFVDHPRKFLSPGDDVEVRIVRMDPGSKKLQLTMLPEEVLHEENVLNKHMIDEDEDDRIQLDEIEVDDELWGEIRRVTDYGAYVELGAVVRGFMHFMDHPLFGEVKGSHPKEFMRVGDRVRVWVLDVDATQKRIKLTANRPSGLPGPRREVKWI